MSCFLFHSDNVEVSSILENYLLLTELFHSPIISDEMAKYSAKNLVIWVIEFVNNG